MGQVLNAPVLTKDSGDGQAPSKGLRWGYSCMQGWRVRMEDAHFAVPALEGDGWADTAAFGVMDGHGGKEVAEFCQENLPLEIGRGPASDARSALVAAFERIDEQLEEGGEDAINPSTFYGFGSSSSGAHPDWVGCTANVCLVRRDVIIVANAGDSRAVMSRRRQAVPLSEDHKPNLPREKDRIQKAGGHVERQQVGTNVQYRVNGNLNLSRSLGDLEYKKNKDLLPSEQMICGTPDVHIFRREVGDEFLILACDGIWDVMGNQDAVDFVHERLPAYLEARRPLSGILEEMLDQCVSPDLVLTKGIGGDNMTAMLVLFDPGAPSGGFCTAVGYQGPMAPGSPVFDDRAIAPSGFCDCRPI
mmetsp:Transcript_88106/g.221754  ORF Transcript_88106/g.221754 Transcript_88106/m.221754 type:complete len:360 (+) Transcript_88106:137-1216(+)|eukprot:CAMPEP_0115517892 /NCGR_PEP_ID=MMETSP0271-20121206/77563_1 /TAXON_ID=71861 /ORGANISM="Scrippsiella trochoidea, Strain CCMP3099" /LENGTH=359 /DNA_ID=CAMNT_0002948703 /DNA_START=108 /DNA_END=1187 /DNA_ORIENTATION=-